MKVDKFTSADIPEAVNLTVEAWSEALADWDKEVARVVCEYSVRDEFLNKELALKITDAGVMKGFILAAAATDSNEADEWLRGQMERFTRNEDLDIFEMVIDASHSNEGLVLSNMGERDAMLTFFLSSQKGCGKILLDEMSALLCSKGYENCLLWTDVTCNHEYYPRHGFTLIDEVDYPGEEGEPPFSVYVYKKKLSSHSIA